MDQPDAGERIAERKPEESVRRLFSETVGHSKAYIAAEKDALTLRVKLTVAIAKHAVTFGVVAGVLALFGFGWLLSSAVAALSIVMHPALAALLVAVVLLVLAFVCLKLATSRLSDLPGGSA